MAPHFITKHIMPCSGTPVHKLTCTHTIHASFLQPNSSSKCAPNCAAVDLSTTAEPSFLCPTCYESTLRDEYQEFVKRCKKKAKEGGCNIEIWCTVFLGHKSFEKLVKENYRRKVEMEKMRDCKAVDGGFE